MTTFARLVNGMAVDVVVSPPTLNERFNPDWLKSHTFYDAPDGTLPGRPGTLNGSVVDWGANPTPPAPDVVPEILSASRFQDVCVAALGGNGAGEDRFGAIIRAMGNSADDGVFSIYQRFLKSSTFDKQKSTGLFAKLVSKSIMTSQERAAILTSWPTV